MHLLGEAPDLAVSVAEYRRATGFLEADDEADILVAAYLRAAQQVVEAATNRPQGRRTARFTLAADARLVRWWFPCLPVAEVLAITFRCGATETAIDPAAVQAHMLRDEPQLVFPHGVIPGGAAGELVVDAVVGTEATHGPLGQAIILIAKDWQQAGIAIDQVDAPRAIFGARALMKQARYLRPATCEGP